MATGDRTFTTEGRKVQRGKSTPLPAGDWEGKVIGSRTEVRTGEESGMPYVAVTVEALNSATQEGGKNRWVFHNLFLTISEYTSKKGKRVGPLVDTSNGITALAKSMGETLNLGPNSIKTITDNYGNELEYVDPLAVKRWLAERDGQVFRFHSKIEVAKPDSGYDDKSVISYFVEAEGQEEAVDTEGEVEYTPPPPPKNGKRLQATR